MVITEHDAEAKHENQELRKWCLELALQWNPNSIDIIKTAEHIYEWVVQK